MSAIAYCHERRIVHRDIKPENIVFNKEGSDAELKVIDFGTSR
jgi:calcium-dependent protein kinase